MISVAMPERARFVRELRNFADRLNDADLVIDQHHRHDGDRLV